jgi:hypothetical protein
LYTDKVEEEGVWNGEEYTWVAKNFRPDHLALLPDLKGACSVADGAGFLRVNEEGKDVELFRVDKKDVLAMVANEMSHESVRSLLSSALRETKENAWIEEVYDAFFIYEEEGKLWKYNYIEDGGLVTLEGTPEQVLRVTEYRTLTGTFVGNMNSNTKGDSMDKEKVIKALIDDKKTPWSEDDRKELTAMSDKALEQLTANQEKEEPAPAKPETPAKEEPAATPATEEPAADPEKPAEEEPEKPAANKAKTAEEYIAEAPESIREVLNSGMATLKREKDKLVQSIIANKQNTFDKEDLEKRSVDELIALARLAGGGEIPASPQPNYQGLGPVAEQTTEEPLPIPVMNFEEEKKKLAAG